MDVADEALYRLSEEVLPFVVQSLSERVAHEQLPLVGPAVTEALRDRSWLLPIIEDEIRRCVRDAVALMLKDSQRYVEFQGAMQLVAYLHEQAERRDD